MRSRGLGASDQLLVRRGVERRAVVLCAVALLLVAVFTALQFESNPAYGIGLLSVVPIVLLALELGLRGGLGAAALASALLAASAAGGHPELGAVGLATRALVFFAIGALAGRFSDQLRAGYEREARLLASGLAVGGATSTDKLAEAVAVAAREVPGVLDARLVADGEPGAEPGILAVPLSARGVALGRIEATADGVKVEDRAALEVLGQQVALALDNQRLLERERERAAVEAELRSARRELLEQRSGLGLLLDSQEEERTRVARRLHEELAQMLAAVLLGLRLIGHHASGESNAAAVDDLFAQVRGVLAGLRELAGTLRPSALTYLGLGPALEALAERGMITLELGDLPDDLPPRVRTGAYRIVQDAAAAAAAPLRVSVDRCDGELCLSVDGVTQDDSVDAIRARAGLLDGTVESSPPQRVLVRLPFRAGT